MKLFLSCHVCVIDLRVSISFDCNNICTVHLSILCLEHLQLYANYFQTLNSIACRIVPRAEHDDARNGPRRRAGRGRRGGAVPRLRALLLLHWRHAPRRRRAPRHVPALSSNSVHFKFFFCDHYSFSSFGDVFLCGFATNDISK